MATQHRKSLGKLEATCFTAAMPRSGGALSCAVVVLVLATAPDAHAYRPFDGTDADIAAVGEFELELGPAHYYRQGANGYVIAPATVLNLGFVRDLELVVDFKQFVGVQRVPDESQVRVLDTDVFLKWVLRRGTLQDETGASIALEGGPLVPEIQGEGRFGAQTDLIASYRIKALTVHFNEQATLTRRGNLDLFSSVILEGPHAWAVRPVAEVFVEHEFQVGFTYSGLVGAIWTARESFALDVGLRVAQIEEGRATEIRLGFTWALPVWSTASNTSGKSGRLASWRSQSTTTIARALATTDAHAGSAP